MPYDEKLAERIRKIVAGQPGFVEKKMFGALVFMLGGHMCFGVGDGELMIRVGKEQYERILAMKHAREMDFTGKPLRGFIYVSASGLKTQAQIKKWIRYAVVFVDSLPLRKK